MRRSECSIGQTFVCLHCENCSPYVSTCPNDDVISTISPKLDRDSKKVRDTDEVFEFEIGTLNVTPPRSFYDKMASHYPPSIQSDEAASPSNIHINNPLPLSPQKG